MDKIKSTTTAHVSSFFSSLIPKRKPKHSTSPQSLLVGATANTNTNGTALAIGEKTDRTTVLPRRGSQMSQHSLLIWLDANINESEDDYKAALHELRCIIASVATFTDVRECLDFLSKIKNKKVVMIVSGSLGQQIIPEIQEWPQLESVYVFCGNQSIHEKWARQIPKVRGVHTQIDPILKALQIDHENCARAMIAISFNGIDTLFKYAQLLKETLLEIEDDDQKSIKQFIHYCHLQDDIAEDQISKVESEYHCHTPIWWYTAPYFMNSMLNYGLRLMDVDVIINMRFFIRDLNQRIEKLYHEQQSSNKIMAPFQLFRGQALSVGDFDKMKQTKGGFVSFNTFLSASRNSQVSFENFARSSAIHNPNLVGILFVINIDPSLCSTLSTSFADVTNEGFFEDCEEEILFTMHTVFRIDQIQHIDDDDTDRLWQVDLTLTGNDDHDLNALTGHIRQGFHWATGWLRIASILMALGESSKAEQLYNSLLEVPSSDEDRANYNHQLGSVYYNMNKYSKALSSYERSLEIRKVALPPNHPDLATSYNSIGNVYRNKGDNSQALSWYQQAIEIRKLALPANHPDLATSYSNIGSTYEDMGDYSTALSWFEQSLEIRKVALPADHSDLPATYDNIGAVYYKMGEHTKALSWYEKALKAREKVLVPDHSDIATSYNNIGVLYYSIGEYSKALSFLEKAHEIDRKALPPNHPHIAQSKKNIENIKKKL
ncbi:unnamed protein product [Rotaria sp. Silwood1]|nr:unnamed protein product [Rotaria sp. Silwood1]